MSNIRKHVYRLFDDFMIAKAIDPAMARQSSLFGDDV
jgi:hypothetical protein